MHSVASQIGVGARAIIEQANRLGLTWTLRPGVISGEMRDTNTRVLLDGDQVPIVATLLLPWVPAEARVMVMLVPPAGAYVICGVGRDDPRMAGRIAFVERTTSSTPNSAAQEVLRLDGVPVFYGRRYEIATNNVIVLPTVAGAVGSLRVAYDDNLAPATSSDDLLAIANQYLATTADGASINVRREYEPPQDQILSFLLFTLRAAGTGNVSTFASVSAGLDIRTQFWIDDVGPARNAAGVIGTVL